MSIFWRLSLSMCLSAGISAAIAGTGHAAKTAGYQSRQSIVDAAREAIASQPESQRYQNLEVTIRSLDSRLRLSQCDQSLSTSFPRNGKILGNRVVGVRCEGGKPWKIFVRASVTAEQSLPALVRALPRNSLITGDDIHIVDFPASEMGTGYVDNPKDLVGMELKRDVSANTAIRANLLAAPKIVKRGQRVIAFYGLGDLQIRMTGIAMKDGANGDRIPIKNSSSNREVDGVVNPDGTIRLQ